EVAIAPAALPQLESATARLQLDLDLDEVAATDVIARLPGAEKCETAVVAHHDAFGPGHPGAADGAAEVALLREVARRLALSRAKAGGTVRFESHGGGEWGGPHPEPPVAAALAERAHTPRDRIARDWDWEDLKRRAQERLVRAGGGS